MNPKVSDRKHATIIGAIQKREEGLLSFLGGFVSLSLMLFAVFLLLFDSRVFLGNTFLFDIAIPHQVALVFLCFIMLLVLKKGCAFFSSRKGKPLIVAASVLGTCIGPLLFELGFPMVSLPLVAIGIVCTGFRWCLRLCEYSHILLVSLISLAFACAISATGLVSMMPLDGLEVATLDCCLALLSWALLRINKTKAHEELMSVSGAESRKRAMTASADRWTYTTIGLDFGFALGLIGAQRQAMTEVYPAEGPASIAVFVLPIVAAGFVLLAFHRKGDYLIERYSKDYLALTITLGVLPLSIAPAPAKYLCLMFLLFVVSIQIIIVINASIEFIRFEELNPAWYMGEEAFVCGGAGVGLAISLAGAANGFDSPLLLVACSLVVVFNIFAQTFMNKGAYPTSDLFENDSKACFDIPLADIPPANHGFDEPSSKPITIPINTGDRLLTMSKSQERVGSWRFKVAYICKKYDLSPRQTEIFELLAKGRDARYIEETFCISKATTKTHIYNIYCRLDIHSKQELIDMVESVTPDEMRSMSSSSRNAAS